MSAILLENVDIEFPVYGARSRRLMSHVMTSGIGGFVETGRSNTVHIQALRDICLCLRDGDRLGLVGHNGAGKSTLLKVMGGIFEPVRGRVRVKGRVSPLFSTYLGMDMEATGRENIFLRGVHLGFNWKAMTGKVEEIIAFTGLASYIDLPLRTYSEGMRARLAFAISTAIEPDILLLDEGFAAGDADFIMKSQARLETITGRAGIAVIATHQERLIRLLCNKALLLEHGAVVCAGSVDEVLKTYRAI